MAITRSRRRPLSLEPLELRDVPAGLLFAASFADSALYQFDADTGALTQTLIAPNSSATLVGPSSMTVGPDGNLYISSQFNNSIVKFDLTTDTASLFIDSTTLGTIATPIVGNANFAPAGLRFGPDGDLYVSLNGGQASTSGAVVAFDVLTGVYAGTNRIVSSPGLVQPTSLTFGPAGDTTSLYVSSSGTQTVAKITGATGGTPTQATFINAATGPGALNYPSGLAWNGGSLYVADLGATSFQSQVKRYNANGSFNSVFATPASSLAAQFTSDILFDAQGRLDTANLGPTQAPPFAGSINRYRVDGALDTVLVSNSTTGIGANGIIPSSLALIAQPVVTSIAPVAGPLAGGTAVTITGTGFLTATDVKFGATSVGFTVNSDTSITVASPAGTGAVPVTVVGPGGTSAVVPAGTFAYQGAPTVTGLSPTTGTMNGGTVVTITGTNLLGASSVTFGGTPATSFTVVSATTITAVAPAKAASTVDVVVTTTSGASATSAQSQFTYVAAAAPVVTAVSPASGPLAGSTAITITGTSFTGATAVTIGGVAATGVTVVNATTITATTPPGTAGIADVLVTTPAGTSAIAAVAKFTYQAAPTVTAVAPTAGPLAGGTTITITGTNFTGATGVTVGGVAATTVTVVSPTSITAVTPAGTAAAMVDVLVTTPSGTSAVATAAKFTYVAAPTVTAITPTSGSLAGGTVITITGTNFTGATGVTLGGTDATSVVVVNATTITATTPARAAGIVDVVVTTAGGPSATSAATKFTYVAAPTVTAVAPASGPVAGGTAITITGTDFTGATAVTIGGTAATNVVVVNDTTITATTSAHAAGIVDVLVTTPSGTSAVGAAAKFAYLVVPTVTAVTPNIGPASGGTAITLTGTGFTGATAVTLGGTAATNVVVVNDTTITAVTPSSANGTVDVLVASPGGTSAISAAAKFTFDSTQPTVTISAPSVPSTSTASVTYTITYTDTNFSASTLTAANVTLNTTGTATGTVSVSAGTGAVRTVTINGITGNGTIGISIAAGTAIDTAGNLAPAAGPSATFVVDNLASFAIGEIGGTVRMVNAVTGGTVNLVRPLDTPNSPYKGLIQVALGDFNNDGVPDLVVAAANPSGVDGLDPTKSGKAFVYDGKALTTGTLTLIRDFTPFQTHDGPTGNTGAYTNGLNVAAGDVNGDGQVDLIAGTRGGSATAGQAEFGRMVAIDGASPVGTSMVIGAIQYPFGVPVNGNGYQKGVVVAAGDADGVGGDEIAVTRGGPVANPNPAVQQIKVKVFQLQGTALAELPLAANGATAFAPFSTLTGPANAINRDGRVAFVDTDGDGQDELVFSALDPLTDPNNTQVRVAVYAIDPAVSAGAATIISTGADQGTYVVGTNVLDHATTHVLPPATPESIAMLVRTTNALEVKYLAPLTGGSRGGIALGVTTGGITIDGI